MKEASKDIWTTYLDTSSLRQINVDSKARHQCESGLNEPNNEMFELAQLQIFNLMKYDSYSRFLKSKSYKDCIINEMEHGDIKWKPSTISTSTTTTSTAQKTESDQDVQISNETNNNDNTNTNTNFKANSTTNSSIKDKQINDPKKKRSLINWSKAKEIKQNAQVRAAALSATKSSPSPTSTTPISKNTTTTTTSPLKDLSQLTALIWPQVNNTNLAANNAKNLESNSNKTDSAIVGDTNISPSNTGDASSPNQLNANFSKFNTPLDARFCRIICKSDSSSTIVEINPNQSIYQNLTKIYNKKQIPWYKCDIYCADNNKYIDQQLDSSVIAAKDINLEEKCLIVLSLISIAINLCIKVKPTKMILTTLKPIFDMYQINLLDNLIYLNSTKCTLNLYETCAKLDNQHIFVIHKQQSNLLSQREIKRYSNISVNDFISPNHTNYQMQVDDLGVLKQV
jgi:hypothetical protein